MASVASGLFKSLPKPKYTGEDEEIPSHAQQRGPRVLGAGALDESQIVLRVCTSRLNKLYVYCDLLNNNIALENRPSSIRQQNGMATTSARRFW